MTGDGVSYRYSSLYIDLGLEEAVVRGEPISQEAIKQAYRSMASKVHPDKEGGSEEKMAKVNAAYAILRDPELRAKYDATGVGEPVMRDKPPVAMELLTSILEQLLQPKSKSKENLIMAAMGLSQDAELNYRTFDDGGDLLVEAGKLLDQGVQNVNQQRTTHLAAIMALEKVLSKIGYKPKSKEEAEGIGHDQARSFNPVISVLTSRKTGHEDAVAQCDQRMVEINVCREMLEHYTFEVATPPPAQERPRNRDDFPYYGEYIIEERRTHPTSPNQRGGR